MIKVKELLNKADSHNKLLCSNSYWKQQSKAVKVSFCQIN